MEIREDIVIVGGGIAGLATALALNRMGIPSLVLEKSNELRTTGTAITLAQNALQPLDVLGVLHKLKLIYTPIQKGNITNVANGTVQEVFYVGEDRNMSGPLPVHRKVLLEAIAEELPVDAIRFSSKLSSIETVKHDGASSVVLTLEDGTIIKAKIVIGCDGVNSVVARQLGLKAPTHSGRVATRGLSVFPQGHGLKHEVYQFIDGDKRVGMVPLNEKELYWFAIVPNEDDDMTRKSPESILKSVLDSVADFPPVVSNVVQHSDLAALTLAPLKFRVPWDLFLNDVYKDNITVAGDAMHPMTPDLAQGGCSSLEDAIVLARHIGNSFALTGKIDSSALKGYAKERRGRAAILITMSYLSALALKRIGIQSLATFQPQVQQCSTITLSKCLVDRLLNDGAHSVVARWLGLLDPIHSGRYDVRGLTVFPEGNGLKHEVQQSVGGSIRTGFASLNDKELYASIGSQFSILHPIKNASLVLEKSNELRTTDAALTLAPNALLALDVLGVSHKLKLIYTPSKIIIRVNVTNVASGTVQEVSYVGKDSTFGSNPLASTVGIASLEVIREEGLAKRSDQMGQEFRHLLGKIQLKFPDII
ncbi:Monooxygenase [Thalictrum thalictroides]|uniref:Monooxygenase n=1 Tax=Thalictrum thalictroides TaxID=46969 RepID=A0A7J6VIS0_THATH|nr:Monooxygenase [Thalictrum thalictroides]